MLYERLHEKKDYMKICMKDFKSERLKTSPSQSVLISLCTVVSAVQSCKIITLEQCFVEGCFGVIALTLQRQNAESVYFSVNID